MQFLVSASKVNIHIPTYRYIHFILMGMNATSKYGGSNAFSTNLILCKNKMKLNYIHISHMSKGAKLGGATGARAPVVFIPCPEIIYICASLFVSLPEVLYIGAPLLFSPVWRQCI